MLPRCLRRTPWTPGKPPSTLRAPGRPSLQPPLRRSSSGQRGSGYSAATQLPPPMPPSWRTAAASSTRRSLPPDAAAPPPHAAGAALGSQPQPHPGTPSYPVTPLFQHGRVRGDRRSGPSSAAEVSPGRHFVFGDGTGAARQRGPLSPGAPRRSLPGAQRSQGLLKRRLWLGQATLTTGG
ncbi:hypothetical protein NDU88_006445 [Pleurodeles waltl]|uniref:Uncharacterized protein n=1 Tax=Pleurodeles waltl TaxID=8319 RepID=A0AAV7LPN5_PLEWA|nr:hypothetical protein NDU88_006445 [Pleurodeles waltl]